MLGALTFSDAQQRALMESGRHQPGKSVNGLILFDTGANISCFDVTAAQQLGLAVIGKANMASASHANHPAPIVSGKMIADQLNINVDKALGQIWRHWVSLL